MTVDFEDRLRASLHREADRALLRSPEWSGRLTQERAPVRRSWLAVAASMVLVAGGVVAVAQAVRTDPDALQSTPPSAPEGDEFPLVALDPSDYELSQYVDNAARPGSGSVFQAGDVVGFAYVGIDITADGEVLETNCTSELLHVLDSCAPQSFAMPLVRMWGWSSDPAEEPAWWVWTNVPDGTSYVQYEDGDSVLWQEPISGVVIFPNVAGDDERVNAIDETGETVASADRDTITRLDESTEVLTGSDEPSTQVVGEYAAQRCMNAAGALEPGADIADGDEIWNECLDAAQQAAEERLAEIAMLDELFQERRPVPSTEPPTSES